MGAGNKYAKIRNLGEGDPLWGQTQKWALVGATPSVSVYDHAEGSESSQLHHSVREGVVDAREQQPLDAPTLNRDARFSEFSSVPAARFFQGYFSVGFSWLAPTYNVVGHLFHAPINLNYNPWQPGTKEAFPATVYNPYPPGSALYPKAL